jgi:mono/diheme cytochrome c family protein
MRQQVGLLLLTLVGCTYEPGAPAPYNPPVFPPPPAASPAFGAPVSGGNLLVTHDGNFVVAADPDRDRVYTVDTRTHALVSEVALIAHDEPGRLIEDAGGRIHVALRRGGALVTLVSANGPVLSRRPVCSEPRGLAYQADGDLVHVACASGELVSLPAAGGVEARRLHLERDLRDVVVVGDQLMVTRFRTAEVLTIDAAGTIVQRDRSPDVQRTFFSPDTGIASVVPSQSAVAWRAVPLPDGSGIVVAHQRARQAPLSTEQGGYGGDPCGGDPIEPTATRFVPGQAPVAGSRLDRTTLPVDVALSPDRQHMAFAMAGDQTVRVMSTVLLDGDTDPCQQPPPEENIIFQSMGMPTSVAYTPDGSLVVFYPDRRFLAVYSMPYQGTVQWGTALPGKYNEDQGRTVFHQMASAGLACASCHPEGHHDGLVWEFRGIGRRRTQDIGGHILQRAPYHWDGDMTDLSRLMNEVFVGRMGGQPLSDWQIKAVGSWLDTIPSAAPPAPTDPEAVARGKQLFESAEAGCSGCHAGTLYTNNLRFDVGTGGVFKVPSLLGVGARAPFLHSGCAATLRDRFSCGGGDAHGHTSQLSEGQIGDLVAYLETL